MFHCYFWLLSASVFSGVWQLYCFGIRVNKHVVIFRSEYQIVPWIVQCSRCLVVQLSLWCVHDGRHWWQFWQQLTAQSFAGVRYYTLSRRRCLRTTLPVPQVQQYEVGVERSRGRRWTFYGVLPVRACRLAKYLCFANTQCFVFRLDGFRVAVTGCYVLFDMVKISSLSGSVSLIRPTDPHHGLWPTKMIVRGLQGWGVVVTVISW